MMKLADAHTAPVIACAFGGQEHLLSANLDGKILHWRISADGSWLTLPRSPGGWTAGG
jgi:hypothetical protein